jgi:integrase
MRPTGPIGTGNSVANLPLPYVQRFKDRHGRARHYFRKPGVKRVALPGEVGSVPFMDAYRDALKSAPQPIGQARTKPGSIRALVGAYYASEDFGNLDPATQRGYRNLLDRFRDSFGDGPVATLSVENVQNLMTEMRDRPGAAASLRKRLARLFDFAKANRWRPDNPVRDAQPPRNRSQGFLDWPEEMIAQFEKAYPAGSRERRALYLILYTAQRRSDIPTMGRQHRRDDKIQVTQFKGRNRAGGPTRLTIPLHPKLKAELERAPKTDLTYLVNRYGVAFTHAGFTNWFVDRARAAGIPAPYAPHGLRKASCRRLAEAGCSASEIMSISGHKSIREVERYTKAAEQKLLAEAAMDNLVEDRARTKRVKPLKKSV